LCFLLSDHLYRVEQWRARDPVTDNGSLLAACGNSVIIAENELEFFTVGALCSAFVITVMNLWVKYVREFLDGVNVLQVMTVHDIFRCLLGLFVSQLSLNCFIMYVVSHLFM
jgi:hypothetical protein